MDVIATLIGLTVAALALGGHMLSTYRRRQRILRRLRAFAAPR